MNDELQTYARKVIKEGLAELPEDNHLFFKRMYSHKNLDADINDVVDNMPEGKLETAMWQVSNTLKNKEKES